MATNKFILRTNDSFQIDSFLNRLEVEYKGYSCVRYYDFEDFILKINAYNLFEEVKEISVLMSFEPEDVKTLGAIISQITEEPVVLVQRKSIPTTKGYTNITADFEIRKLESMKVEECIRWVSNTLKNKGVKFSNDIPGYMVAAIGNEPYVLLSEIDKLSLISEDLRLDKENINTLIASSEGINYFSFMDHLTHLRFKETIDGFYKVEPQTYSRFISFITSQLDKYYKISVYKAQNLSAEEISEIVGLPAFILKTKVFTIFSFVPKAKLLKMLNLFLELSEKLRVSKLSKELLFESYLLKILKA
jgi:DNA polymerase III delta subunit